jgi:hypothetical protein
MKHICNSLSYLQTLLNPLQSTFEKKYQTKNPTKFIINQADKNSEYIKEKEKNSRKYILPV